MSCALTQGYVADCDKGIGGAKEFKVIEIANVADITETAGIITAIDNVTAKRWWSYKPPRDTVYGKGTRTVNQQNGTAYVAQEVGFALNKMSTNTRMEIEKLVLNTVYVAVADRNGKYWLYGYKNGLDVSGGESGTGTAPGDRNGYSLTLAGSEPEDAIEIDAATWATLETPGV